LASKFTGERKEEGECLLNLGILQFSKDAEDSTDGGWLTAGLGVGLFGCCSDPANDLNNLRLKHGRIDKAKNALAALAKGSYEGKRLTESFAAVCLTSELKDGVIYVVGNLWSALECCGGHGCQRSERGSVGYEDREGFPDFWIREHCGQRVCVLPYFRGRSHACLQGRVLYELGEG